MRLTGSSYARWIPGILVALSGVCIARLVTAVLPAEYQSVTFVLGSCIAIIGIFMTAAASGRSTKKSKQDKKP